MRFEIYMRDGELSETFKSLFGLIHEYIVFGKCTQIHVILSK